jgi:hypothetical protein
MVQSVAAPMFRKVIFPAKIVKQPPLLNGRIGDAIFCLKYLRLLMKVAVLPEGDAGSESVVGWWKTSGSARKQA